MGNRPKKGKTPTQLKPYLFKKGHKPVVNKGKGKSAEVRRLENKCTRLQRNYSKLLEDYADYKMNHPEPDL
jgi:TfoX/Sxy family transcriptional regulator of competence genes